MTNKRLAALIAAGLLIAASQAWSEDLETWPLTVDGHYVEACITPSGQAAACVSTQFSYRCGAERDEVCYATRQTCPQDSGASSARCQLPSSCNRRGSFRIDTKCP